MILAVDIGNTHTVLGLYEGNELSATWRVATDPTRTADEIGLEMRVFFSLGGHDYQRLTAIVACSVVPPVLPTWEEAFRRYFGQEAMVVGPGTKTGVPVRYENPKEVGADRVVNAVAAIAKYGSPLIVADFGTATTFDAISAHGEYLGGAICPGIQVAADALFSHTAKLPRVELVRPARVIGKTTTASIQAGVIYGSVGQVREIVRRMAEEIGGQPRVIATGGLAEVIAPETGVVDVVDQALTLDGLRLIWERNQVAA